MAAMLEPHEYDGAYFDGRLHDFARNAGYSVYRDEGVWAQRARAWADAFDLRDRKVLEVGCAKGFFVEALLDEGVDAYGMDFSEYCLLRCDIPGTDSAVAVRRPDLVHRFTLGDARYALTQFDANEFDVIVSSHFLACIPEQDLPPLVRRMAQVAVRQVHLLNIFDGDSAARFYTDKTPAEWRALFEGTQTTLLTALDGFG